MIVRHDGSIIGTIGGSAVEALIIEDAKDVIRKSKARQVEYNLDDVEGKSTGMICGGIMEFFIEPLKRYPRLYIFGGGHVGYAVSRFACELGYPYVVIDNRPEFASQERFPEATELHSGDYVDLIQKVDFVQPAYIIIVTSGHDADYEVLKGSLQKLHDYLGIICSRKKKADLLKKLEKEGFTKKELDRVHAPIGLDIGSKTPAEIAISILAEVILEFYGPKHK
jgi:xanthine dehydrogenase accessory factor